MPATRVLSLDASNLNGFNQTTYVTEFFAALVAGTTGFYGGTPDSAFGSTYYMNGDQVLTSYTEDDGAGGTQPADAVALLGGEGLAYDFIHNGPAFGHGISGAIDSLTFGSWVEGESQGTQGTGADGLVTGLETGLVIEGLDLFAAPGSGNDPLTNPVHALYNALRLLNADAIYDLISGYDLEVTGSAGADQLRGYAGSDLLLGLAGDDFIGRSAGADTLLGGSGNDTLLGGRGRDDLRGGAGDDVLTGGAGADQLRGGAGADTFVLLANSGLDVVHDFAVGEDIIDITALGLSGLGDLSVTETAGHVDVVSGSVTLRLLGLTAAEVTEDLFLF